MAAGMFFVLDFWVGTGLLKIRITCRVSRVEPSGRRVVDWPLSHDRSSSRTVAFHHLCNFVPFGIFHRLYLCITSCDIIVSPGHTDSQTAATATQDMCMKPSVSTLSDNNRFPLYCARRQAYAFSASRLIVARRPRHKSGSVQKPGDKRNGQRFGVLLPSL
jgi:hypothetical protein